MARCIKGKCNGIVVNDNDKSGAGCRSCGAPYKYMSSIARAGQKPVPDGWDPKKYAK